MDIQAWRHWYHCTVGTYGQWLPGDDRGYRERDHHMHVEGDYKNPPKPSNFAKKRLESAKRLMKGDPYFIAPAERPLIGRLILESLRIQRIPIRALAVSAKNFHALVQCVDDLPKPAMGKAKTHVTFRFAPIVDPIKNTRQRLWETDCGVTPIVDQAHAYRAFKYILDHWRKEGAWVWSYRDGLV
jgi:hypothetical protein